MIEAWSALGLRYDVGLQTIVHKPNDANHSMTLRSHRLSLAMKKAIDPCLPVCDITELMETLRAKSALICFIKKNGQVRRMQCTMKRTEMIHVIEMGSNMFNAYDEAGCTRMRNNLLVVWDLDRQGWRSLYIDRIITVDQGFFICDIM